MGLKMSIFISGNNDYFTQYKTKLVDSQTETPATSLQTRAAQLPMLSKKWLLSIEIFR